MSSSSTLFLGLSQTQAKLEFLIFPDKPSLNMHYLTKLGSFTAVDVEVKHHNLESNAISEVGG